MKYIHNDSKSFSATIYHTITDILIAICTGGCGLNMNCTAPENCTCVQGWTGQDCLTGKVVVTL